MFCTISSNFMVLATALFCSCRVFASGAFHFLSAKQSFQQPKREVNHSLKVFCGYSSLERYHFVHISIILFAVLILWHGSHHIHVCGGVYPAKIQICILLLKTSQSAYQLVELFLKPCSRICYDYWAHCCHCL
jgi:hypothetical protein